MNCGSVFILLYFGFFLVKPDHKVKNIIILLLKICLYIKLVLKFNKKTISFHGLLVGKRYFIFENGSF